MHQRPFNRDDATHSAFRALSGEGPWTHSVVRVRIMSPEAIRLSVVFW